MSARSIFRCVNIRRWSVAALVSTTLVLGCTQKAPEPPVFSEADIPAGDRFAQQLDEVLDFNCNGRILNTRDHAAWQVVHGILSYGPALKLEHEGTVYSALDYLLKGGQLNGWSMRAADHGLQTLLDGGSNAGQGHPDQWVGYISQCGWQETPPADTKITYGGKEYTIRDLVNQAQWDITEVMKTDSKEASWTLMALTAYWTPFDAKWTARDGTEWDVEKIVESEAAQNINESACGGTHRLYALAAALNRHLEETKTDIKNVTGPWKAADEQIQKAIGLARQYQQPDGSFSANYFVRPGSSSDVVQRIRTTGHILEFLSVAASDEQFNQPWVAKSAVSLVDMLERTKSTSVECGALYHATHGLMYYRLRKFGKPQTVATTAAKSPTAGATSETPAQAVP
jgi:hypothetical protein